MLLSCAHGVCRGFFGGLQRGLSATRETGPARASWPRCSSRGSRSATPRPPSPSSALTFGSWPSTYYTLPQPWVYHASEVILQDGLNGTRYTPEDFPVSGTQFSPHISARGYCMIATVRYSSIYVMRSAPLVLQSC